MPLYHVQNVLNGCQQVVSAFMLKYFFPSFDYWSVFWFVIENLNKQASTIANSYVSLHISWVIGKPTHCLYYKRPFIGCDSLGLLCSLWSPTPIPHYPLFLEATRDNIQQMTSQKKLLQDRTSKCSYGRMREFSSSPKFEHIFYNKSVINITA